MSEKQENKQCPICHGYLFDDDDTVVCPVCGAPHHRDCYKSVGHCGLEELHGTDKQYDKAEEHESNETAADEEVHECRFCGRTARGGNADFCPYCGQPYDEKKHRPPFLINGFPVQGFDACGGVDKEKIIDGVRAGDLATFVTSASGRYIPRFSALNKNSKGSWNWAAFLFPSAWCASRKMYINSLLFLVLSLAAKLCFFPFFTELEALGDISKMGYTQLAEFATQNIASIHLFSIILLFAGTLLTFIPRIVCGRLGDWFYRGFAVSKVKTILASPDVDDTDDELRRSGSVNIIAMFGMLIVEEYLPRIVAAFIF